MLQAIDLTKRYEDGHLALDHVNFEVKSGEIFSLLGANGAGKTTTINLFLNFIDPTDGQALINGIDAAKAPLEAKKHIAYVSENVMLYGNFTARQNLDFFAKLGGRHNLTRDDYYAVMREVGSAGKGLRGQAQDLLQGHAPEDRHRHRHHQGRRKYFTGRADVGTGPQGRCRVSKTAAPFARTGQGHLHVHP